MRVLLTGAAGRIGFAVAQHLAGTGFDVRAADKVYRSDLPAPLEVVDLLDREVCYRLLDGVEAVVHLANHPGPRRSDPQTVYNENVSMNMNVFEAAAQMGVGKIVFASSIQAMTCRRRIEDGENPPPSKLAYLPLDGDSPFQSSNTYGLSKQCSEVMLAYYAELFGMACVALRFPSTWPTDQLDRIRRHIDADPRRHWNLDEVFSYLFAEDAARLVEAILRAPLEGFRPYLPTAARPSTPTPIPELIEEFYQGVPLRKPVEELTSLVDLTRITEETGWEPEGDIWA